MPALPNGHAENPLPMGGGSATARHARFIAHASKILAGTVPLTEDDELVYAYRVPSVNLVHRVPSSANVEYGRVTYRGLTAYVERRGREPVPVVELGPDLALELIGDLTNRAYAQKQELTAGIAERMYTKNLSQPNKSDGYLQKQYDDLLAQLTAEMFRQKDLLKRDNRPRGSGFEGDGRADVSDEDVVYDGQPAGYGGSPDFSHD